MFKLLRNFALAGLLVAGIMKLLAWWVVGRDAEHVIAALAPYATIKYDGISAGLDGTISLDQVSLDAGHHVYRADSVAFEAPSLFWLFGHALFGGSGLPAQFSLSVEGLKLPPLPWLDPKLFDPVTFVPFPAAACGNGLNDADYRRIGNVPAQTHERLDYRYDAAQHSLNLILSLQAPGFSKIDIGAELKRFDPAALTQASMWDHAHLEQVAATYTDLDYLARRNQFCAQRTGSANPAQFIERHIGAVQELLKAKRAEASSELMQLYRTLLEHGGHASLLSLPSAGFVIATLHGAPEELLRQLNVTARYQDKPPIMFRVAFAPAPEEPPAAPAEPQAAVVSASTAAAPAPVASAATDAQPAPIASSPAPTAMPATVPVSPKPTAASAAVAPLPVAVAAATNPAPAATPAPAAVTPPSPKSNEANAAVKATRDNLGLHMLDREEARLAAITPPLAPPPKRDAKPMPDATLGPSAAAPPDPVLAMVWKPAVFEPLPESGPERKTYDVIDFGRLGSVIGRYVQVITEGGKKIGGLVLGVDDTGVKLQVNRDGGNITFVVTKTRVQEIRLPRY